MKQSNAFQVALILTLAMANFSCSSSSSGTGVERATGVSGAINDGATKIKAALPGGTSRVFVKQMSPLRESDLTIRTADMSSGQFTTTISDLQSTTSVLTSPKSFIQFLVDETPEEDPNNGMGIFQRYRQKVMQSLCAFNVLLPDTDGNLVPDLGTHSTNIPATLSATMKSQCPEVPESMFDGSTGGADLRGLTVNATITDVSGLTNSQYDVKGVFSGGSGPITGQSLGEFYFRNSGGVIRFMFLESGQSLAMYEYTSGQLKFEYISGFGSQREHFRLFSNETSGDMGLYGYVYNGGTGPDFVYASAVTNTLSATQGAIAMTTTTTFTDARACITPNDLMTHLGTWGAACTSITGAGLATTPAIVSGFASYSLLNTNINQEDEIQFTSSANIVSGSFPQ